MLSTAILAEHHYISSDKDNVTISLREELSHFTYMKKPRICRNTFLDTALAQWKTVHWTVFPLAAAPHPRRSLSSHFAYARVR